MTNTKIIEMHSSSFEKRNIAKTIPNLFKISVLGLILAGHTVSCSPESRSVREIGDPIVTLGRKDSPRDVWVGAAMFEGLWGAQIPNEIDVEESAGSPESSNKSTSAGSSTDKPISEVYHRASANNGASSSSSGPSRPTSPEFPFPIQSPRHQNAAPQTPPQTPRSAKAPLSPAPETPECTLPRELPPSTPNSKEVGMMLAFQLIGDFPDPNCLLRMMSGEPVFMIVDGKETEMNWVDFLFWLAEQKKEKVTSNIESRGDGSAIVSVRFPNGRVMNVINGKFVVLQLPDAAAADHVDAI